MHIHVALQGRKTVETQALIDSGAGGQFIDKNFVLRHDIRTKPIKDPISVFNVDGTPNRNPQITRYADIAISTGGEPSMERLLVTSLGKESMILGFPWLQHTNPKIDWKSGRMDIPRPRTSIEEVVDEEVAIDSLREKLPMDHPRILEDPEDISFVINYIGGQLEFSWDDEQETWIQAHVATELAQKAGKDNSPKTLEEQLPDIYSAYQKVFEKKASDRLPQHQPWDHEIDLKPDFQPRPGKVYPLAHHEREEMDKFIDENLEKGYIRPSQSPFAAPFFFVGKKDGKLRPCQDYCELNTGTIKNAYPLPLISDLMEELRGSTVFTKLDLRAGYNNVRIKEGHEHKAAFKTSRGLFEPLVMFFGLCNSPATFQKMMNKLFKDMIDEGWLKIYMDDLLLHSKDITTHRERTKRVLQRLMDNDLYLKIEKCCFEVPEVEWLGMILSANRIGMDPIKLQGIADWPTPKNVKQTQGFLGFANFYRRFIASYSHLARPLNDLTKKDLPWDWTPECEDTFTSIKHRFSEAPVLLMPDPTKPFLLATDASKYATGGVLSQRDGNGIWHPCGFISQSFSEAERNYQIYDRELLAIIRGFETWRHFLMGSPHKVTVHTNHKNLTFYRTPQKLNRRQARWQLFLSEFEFELIHVPGNRMAVPDALSRRPDLCPEEDNDNEDQIMLPEEVFVKTMDVELHKQFTEIRTWDKVIMDALDAIKQGGTLPMKSALKDWREEDGIIFYKDRVYVPPNDKLRHKITCCHHNLTMMGHPGRFKTLELIRRDYWWPGMYTFVHQYVEGCAICQQNKVNTHPTTPPLMPIKGPDNTRPFSQLSVDLITDLPPSNGFDSLMVVVDHGLTKGVILTPCTKTIDAMGVAKLFLENVYKRFGLHDSLISD